MNRPVPEGHMTSPPQSVSIPRTASATNRPIASIDPSSRYCPGLGGAGSADRRFCGPRPFSVAIMSTVL